MLISKTDNDDQQEGVVDPKLPVCPNCGSAKEGILEQGPSPASFIISLICLYYCGIWSVLLIPLVFQSTKVIIKRCQYCNQELEKRNYFQLPNINDQVMQFKFGNCMIVASRKYALILLGIIFLLFFYFQQQIEKEPIKIEIDYPTDKSWMDFLQLCGKFQFVENGLKARHQFETNFKGKIVAWNGIYVKTKSNNDMNYSYSHWVYIKMDPTESTDDIPDVVLGVNSQQYSIEKFNLLEQGQSINFNAKFISLGSEYNFHILELKQLEINTSESLVDIKQIKKFTLIMDQSQQLKQTKLQDSLKRMIHMYQPRRNDSQSDNQNNVFRMGLSAEEIQKIEEDIEELQKQLELEDQQENEQVVDQSSQIKNDQLEDKVQKEEKDRDMTQKLENNQDKQVEKEESTKDSSIESNLDQQ
ncbi:unnamed protein product (macronuclear) [Paramecium tetraurelia]|uniref:LITAF domain-containing protein n=1 Tax=Paramecium tetraurelia TaxID=5888 RepID=A0BAZ4_PARTE|nr:uncharacterized protein GSPATT00000146001 [Paramecium tetraurelia]CAK55711.1 unnamed protein product [Paramecium tetraurelia]|eukprot:XP_001423109.1 hypothetical protein (macronuclear) [Paramecium tetraurelia strain d4-2]